MEDTEKPPVELKAGECQVTATIQITRAATGKVEEYVLVGTVPREIAEQLEKK